MTYAEFVDLDDLPAYAREKLLTLKHGEKGDLADYLKVSAGNVSHWITGRRAVPLDQVKGILAFFKEEADVSVKPKPDAPGVAPVEGEA